MGVVQHLVIGLYFLVFAVLSVYGAHRYALVRALLRHRKETTPAGEFSTLPRVTVQLPVYNEAYVVERLIRAVCEMDYPRDRFEVQVLDDSTDETCEIAQAAVARFRSLGVNISYLHRTDRKGFKAGALEEGLRRAKGEFIAIFDADFVPPSWFLRKTIHYFTDESVGMVQSRWDHLNRNQSLLTRIQSMLLDGHFVVEHGARYVSGCFFNFNGTAGIWRKRCIEDAGGWHHDTLTEDLDLSYRAQLKGWSFVYLPDIAVPSEIPVEMNAFKTQQFRWAKGSIQTARKLLPAILKAPLRPRVKFEAFVHLTCNVAHPLMVLLALLIYPAMLIRFQLNWSPLWIMACDAAVLAAATLSVCTFYVCSQVLVGQKLLPSVLRLPALMSIGIGISISNALAVLEALMGRATPFERTPKYGSAVHSARWKRSKYRGKRGWLPYVELLFGIYFTWIVLFALKHCLYATVPFLFLFQFGYLYTAFMSLFQRSSRPFVREEARQGG